LIVVSKVKISNSLQKTIHTDTIRGKRSGRGPTRGRHAEAECKIKNVIRRIQKTKKTSFSNNSGLVDLKTTCGEENETATIDFTGGTLPLRG